MGSTGFDYDFNNHTRGRKLNTNVIDHRPSLLLSSQLLMNRSTSPTFRSPKLPMQEVYRSLMQNRPYMNIDKLIGKQRLTYLENVISPVPSTTNQLLLTKNTEFHEVQAEVQKKPTVKPSPSLYRQKNCEGCAHKRHLFDRKFASEQGPQDSHNEHPAIRRGYGHFNIQHGSTQKSTMYDKPSWKFGRPNSSSYRSPTKVPSAVSSARSHPSSYGTTDIESKTNFTPRSSRPSSVGVTDNIKSSKAPTINMDTRKPKPDCLKRIFVVNGSVVSFNGYGFESFANWFGDETMLRSENKTKPLVHKELDMSGFTNQEIDMKLYDGNKLVVEATRPLRGRYPAMHFKDTILLPKGLPVESLLVCRTKSGLLVIEDIPRPFSFPKERLTTA